MYKTIQIISLGAISIWVAACTPRPEPPDPVTPGIYVYDASADEGAGKISFAVKQVQEQLEAVVINYSIEEVPADNTNPDSQYDKAKLSSDFSLSKFTGTLELQPGQAEATIDVAIKDEDVYERDESFILRITSVGGAALVQGQAKGVIKNDDPAPIASITPNADSVSEEDSIRSRAVTVTLDRASSLPAVLGMNYVETTTATSTATKAKATIDYWLEHEDGTPMLRYETISIPEPQTTVNLRLVWIDDGVAEGDEQILVQLAAVRDISVAAGSKGRLSITMSDTDSQPHMNALNDTGVVGVVDVVSGTASLKTYEDANQGADSSELNNADGHAGFRFQRVTNVDAANADLSVQPDAGATWDCVYDMRTGLVWENKVANSSVDPLRYAGRLFRWYNPDNTDNGGVAGVGDTDEFCTDTQYSQSNACSISNYAAQMNKIQLCGTTGWRVPSIEELHSLMNYEEILNPPTDGSKVRAIDTDYFSLGGTVDQYGVFWSSTTYANDPTQAWVFNFMESRSIIGLTTHLKDETSGNSLPVMLVNDSLVPAGATVTCGGGSC